MVMRLHDRVVVYRIWLDFAVVSSTGIQLIWGHTWADLCIGNLATGVILGHLPVRTVLASLSMPHGFCR